MACETQLQVMRVISDCDASVACIVVDCAPVEIVVLPGCDWNKYIALIKKQKLLLVHSINDLPSDKQNATYFKYISPEISRSNIMICR